MGFGPGGTAYRSTSVPGDLHRPPTPCTLATFPTVPATGMNQAPDPSRCPLCGLANDCAEASASGQPCWCLHTPIDPEALRRIPLDAQGKACLCPRCAGLLTPEEPT